MTDELPKITDYTLRYWRQIAEDYGVRLPRRATKAEIYKHVIVRMRLHAAMLANPMRPKP